MTKVACHPSRISEDRRIELEPYRDLTRDDVARAVRELPDAIRERLAKGPTRNRWACGVCHAMPDVTIYEGDRWRDEIEMDDPRRIVMEYHEVPKLDMQYTEDQWYGEIANEVYRRCITIYRAAGWTGDATEPDA